VLIEGGATAGVDVRGAAPATRDTDLLNPTKMVEQIFGIALSGGSLFGLSSVTACCAISRKERRILYGGRHIPIVPGASIFDLGVGDATVRPAPTAGTAPPRPQPLRRLSKAASGRARAQRSASSQGWNAR